MIDSNSNNLTAYYDQHIEFIKQQQRLAQDAEIGAALLRLLRIAEHHPFIPPVSLEIYIDQGGQVHVNFNKEHEVLPTNTILKAAELRRLIDLRINE